jgi:hypothetical protein
MSTFTDLIRSAFVGLDAHGFTESECIDDALLKQITYSSNTEELVVALDVRDGWPDAFLQLSVRGTSDSEATEALKAAIAAKDHHAIERLGIEVLDTIDNPPRGRLDVTELAQRRGIAISTTGTYGEDRWRDFLQTAAMLFLDHLETRAREDHPPETR